MHPRRNTVLLGFAALGIFWGAWGAALPAVQRRSGAGDAELGLALLLVGLGALVSMRATGVVMDRIGPRLTPASAVVFAIAGLAPGLANSPLELYLFVLVLGAGSGALDVAINADAVRWEIHTGESILNLAHACFSVAVVLASVATGLLRWAGAGAPLVFALAAAVVLLTALAMRSALDERWSPPPEEERSRFFQRFPAWLVVIGTLGALAFWIEGAWQDWGALYLERTLSAAPAVSALGPALFAAAMAAGRLGVHRLASPGGERPVLVVGAGLAGAGSALAAAAPWTPIALAGIVVAGAGCSVCAPTIVSLAGRAAGRHERATVVGSVTTLMYLGFLVGPAAVGGFAELSTLRTSLGGVAALAFLLVALFAIVRLPVPQR